MNVTIRMTVVHLVAVREMSEVRFSLFLCNFSKKEIGILDFGGVVL